MSTKRPPLNVRDRVKELRRVPAKDLHANPRNWRAHPKAQRDAMKGVLAELGFAGAMLARELPDGTLQLIDGHLRGETLPADFQVPVLVLDLNEEEANYLLATHDPLSALATQDDSKLIELLHAIDSDDAAVQKMLGDLVKLPEEGGDGFGAPEVDMKEQFLVMVTCEDEKQQIKLIEQLLAEGYDVKARNS